MKKNKSNAITREGFTPFPKTSADKALIEMWKEHATSEVNGEARILGIIKPKEGESANRLSRVVLAVVVWLSSLNGSVTFRRLLAKEKESLLLWDEQNEGHRKKSLLNHLINQRNWNKVGLGAPIKSATLREYEVSRAVLLHLASTPEGYAFLETMALNCVVANN